MDQGPRGPGRRRATKRPPRCVRRGSSADATPRSAGFRRGNPRRGASVRRRSPACRRLPPGLSRTPPGSLRNPADRRELGARAPSVTIGAWRELGARAISLRDFQVFPPWLEPNPRFFPSGGHLPGRIVQCGNYPCVFRCLIFAQMGGTFCLCACARAPPPPPCSAGPKNTLNTKQF